LIRKGEGKRIEFKETFSKNIKTGQNDFEIEKASLKTIVGFLNAGGGTLLIGISDNGEIKGVENDNFLSQDKYKLYFKDKVKEKIGTEFSQYIDYELFNVREHYVLKVECSPSNNPCFYIETKGETEIFYVRLNPSTEKLVGKKLLDYVNDRFYGGRKQLEANSIYV